jgi:two-component system, OmpR family, KDP operon response regulator KdpE
MAREDQYRILVVDDHPDNVELLRARLQARGYEVDGASGGEEALEMIKANPPDLILLDVMMPRVDGMEVVRRLKADKDLPFIPVIMQTALDSTENKVEGLDAGADDYITKPFSTIELQARIRAALRRSRVVPLATATAPVTIENLTIDFAKPAVTRGGHAVHLTKTEWQLLRTLARYAGRTMTHRQIFAEVWGKSFGDAQQNLRVHIRSLRRKLENDPVRPRIIVTEPGVGYRFEGAA